MKVQLLPQTKMGKWSIGLIVCFFLAMGIFFVFVWSGEKGGKTFFSNPRLAIPVLIAAATGILSFLIGIISIIKSRDRAIFTFISSLIGLLVTLWVIAEIISAH